MFGMTRRVTESQNVPRGKFRRRWTFGGGSRAGAAGCRQFPAGQRPGSGSVAMGVRLFGNGVTRSLKIQGKVLAQEAKMLVQREQGKVVLSGMLGDDEIGDAHFVNAVAQAGHLHLDNPIPVQC